MIDPVSSAKEIIDWEDIADSVIREKHPVIYDDFDRDSRRIIQDLSAFPREDDLQREVKIYDERGRKIARRCAILDSSADPCGILLKLRGIEAFFSDGHQEDDACMDEDEPRETVVSAYPQAFLREYGHVQVSGVTSASRDVVNNINKAVTLLRSVRRGNRGNEGDGNESDDSVDSVDDLLSFHPRSGALSAISSQVYNEVQHRVRPTAALHEAQQGLVTACLSGAYSTTPKAVNNAKAKLATCSAKRPHQSFRDKLSVQGVPRDLRYEVVYHVNCLQLADNKRRGS